MLQMLSCSYEGRQGKGDVMFRHVKGLANTSRIIMDASSRLASRIIAILEWEEASEQTETAQTACAEAYAKVEPVMQVIVCLRPFTQVGCSLAR